MLPFAPQNSVNLDRPASLHSYRFDDALTVAVNVAIAGREPLLIRAEPGFPVRDVAQAAAQELGWVLVEAELDAGDTLEPLLWTYDEAMHVARASRPAAGPHDDIIQSLFDGGHNISSFVRPGPVWWAFDRNYAQLQHDNSTCFGRTSSPLADYSHDNDAKGVVLFIEGLDTANARATRRLRRTLARGYFDPPGGARVMLSSPVLTVLSSFAKDTGSAALSAQCVVHQIQVPEDREQAAHYLTEWSHLCAPQLAPSVRDCAVKCVVDARENARRLAQPVPGTQDFFNLLRIADVASTEPSEQIEAVRKTSGALLNFPLGASSFGERAASSDGPEVTAEDEEDSQPPTVFISYATAVEAKFVQRLYDRLVTLRYNVKLDRANIEYRDRLSRYISALGSGGAVVAIVSDAYLRSPYCMWELLNVYNASRFQERLFPIVLPDAHITDGVARLEYTRYWQEKISQFNAAMRAVDPVSISRASIEEAERIRAFANKVDHLAAMVADMNFRPVADLSDDSLAVVELHLAQHLQVAGVEKRG